MSLRLIASLMLSASIFFGSVPFSGFPGKDNPDGIVAFDGSFVPASYDSYEVTLADGGTVKMSLTGSKMILDPSDDRSFDITLSKCSNQKTVKSFFRGGDVFDIELASYMNDGEIYYLSLSYDAFGTSITNGNNIVFKNGNNVYFWKSANYEYNLETCSEMWTDEQSLKECLEPQNDVECDDPEVVRYSMMICDGAADDWEKVYRIYDYIAHGMAYDNVESNDNSCTYQDSALDVLRDGKGLCEGFANVFVALCRAQGIPAAVEFGLGYGSYGEMISRTPQEGELADHAWAAVFLGGKWLFVDPTYDISKYYYSSDYTSSSDDETNYYLLPLESFSNDHVIMDADTRHGIESSGSCGPDARYKITRDGTCYIWGSGKLKMPVGVNCFNKIVFDENCTITYIEKNCFNDCDLITTVILPRSVKNIEEYAFKSCEDLEYVYIPESCKKIGNQAFDYCDELSYIRIPDSVKEIGSWAFDDCPRLYISVPSHLADFVDDYSTMPMYIEVR